MKFKRLLLRNFQTHKQLELDLAKGITTIRGASDVGKSAILRALRLTALNDLAGMDYIRHGAKEAFVEILVCSKSEESIVRRLRSSRENAYFLDEKAFYAFGKGGVPEDIAKLLRLSPINFQSQHDAPFWFSDSPLEVSRQLNSVIDLSLIDTSLANISKAVYRAQETKRVSEERLKQVTDELETANAQKERVADYKRLTEKKQEYAKIEKDFNRLERIVEQAATYPLKSLREHAEDAGALAANASRAVKLERRAAQLEDLVSNFQVSEKLAEINIPLSELERLWSRFERSRAKWAGLSVLIEQIDSGTKNLKRITDFLKTAEERLHQLKGEQCPLCGNQIQ